MKHTDEPHGETHAPEPGGIGGGAHASVSERFIIVDLPDNFDINEAFGSEQDAVGSEQDVADDSTASVGPIAPPSAPESPRESRPDPESTDAARTNARSLLIADLLDNRVRLEWHEAVAIAQHLCGVMVRDPAANVHHSLVEPWNVQITNAGDIRVLPGGSSSDPLVKQVGRVLGALLQDSIAPAELRLVASQASFEVPVYSSVEELSAALRRFERPGDLDAIRAAYQRGLDAKFSALPARAHVAPAASPSANVDDQSPVRKGPRAPLAVPLPPASQSGTRVAIAAVAAVLVVAVSVVIIRSMLQPSDGTSAALVSQSRNIPVEPQRTASAPEKHEIESQPKPPTVATSAPDAAPGAIAPPVSHRASGPAITRGPAVPAAPVARAPAPSLRRPPSTAAGDSSEAERRAAGLLAAGNADDAALIYDAIVLRNPTYQLDPARSSPEALAAFQASKRALLPVLARRRFDDARAAFDAGDFSKAIGAGEQALTLLNNLDVMDPGSADLAVETTNLVTRATAARTAEEETIYAAGDPGVTPPRPLSRQLATTALLRNAMPPTGRLEILVGRSGKVETVRLDTPSNGYHDRMIVSAVKAWRYRPAFRNGKPVRFTVVMSISLPEP